MGAAACAGCDGPPVARAPPPGALSFAAAVAAAAGSGGVTMDESPVGGDAAGLAGAEAGAGARHALAVKQ